MLGCSRSRCRASHASRYSATVIAETLPDERSAVSSGGCADVDNRQVDSTTHGVVARLKAVGGHSAYGPGVHPAKESDALLSAESPLTASDDEIRAVSSRGLRIGTATIESANSYARRPVCGTTPRMNRSPTNVCRSPHHGHCLEWWSPRTSTRRCGPCWPQLRQRRGS